MDTIWAVVALAAIAVAAVLAVLLLKARHGGSEREDELLRELDRANATLEALAAQLGEVRGAASGIAQQQHTAAAVDQQRFMTMTRELTQMEDRMDDLRRDNAHQLEQMRATVDEKLTRTLNDRLSVSFKQVSEQLEAVYKGLGDMQSIASGVGDLKRVLGNVKTRGILGEVQLAAILSDILAPDQYLENVVTKPGSTERVEFAVKLPADGGEPVLMPIDSKFPGDSYAHLLDAIDTGDADAIAQARKRLDTMVKREARDISEKYLAVPATTSFGIMFLPFEGLYAEVVNRPGLVEELGRDFRVNVAGPSTMAAILNSLQMSYQTFRLQKRTDDVLRVLSAVKAELPKYQAALRRAQQQIETAGKTVDSIITTRTNVMERKLRGIDVMEDGREAERVLGLDGLPDSPDGSDGAPL